MVYFCAVNCKSNIIKMEQLLYETMLYLAAGINLILAFVLVYNNYQYRYYDVYRRSRLLSAAVYAAFAVGFLLHAQFQWRTVWPCAATALSVSYFHVGAVFFGWSHTSLLRPDYLTRRIVVRDLAILFLGIISYWLPLTIDHSPLTITHAPAQCSMVNGQWSMIIFFAHATFIALTFYRTYFRVRRSIEQMPADGDAPRWWTPEAKRQVLHRHRSFIMGCHLIVLFGIGSVVVTACFPTQTWPYTVLLTAAILVFCYIFYALSEYGTIIDTALTAQQDYYRGTPAPPPCDNN